MTLLPAILAARWLITADWLETIIRVAERDGLDPDLAARLAAERAARPSAMALRDGRRLDGASVATVRDGVALIPITGPVFRRANLITDYSGGTSTGVLAQDIQAAIDDPGVGAILYVIDSPGGEATGIHELANVIYAARERKPSAAYAEGMMASAAYWLGSAAGTVVADATAALGSIGAVMAVRDPDKANAKEIEIVSSQSPRKRPDVRTEAGRGQLQQIVDDLASVFVASVARNRGVDEDAVLSNFGRGGLLVGQAAVEAGLADSLGSFEGTLAALAAQVRERRATPARWAATVVRSAMDEQETAQAAVQAEPAVSLEEIAALRAQLEAQAAEVAALKAERERLESVARDGRFAALAQGWVGAAEDHLAVLRVLGEGSPAAAAYARTMAAATEQANTTALLERLGQDGPAAPASAWEEIDRKARAIAAAEGMTHAAAVAAVAQREPTLYDRYLKERG